MPMFQSDRFWSQAHLPPRLGLAEEHPLSSPEGDWLTAHQQPENIIIRAAAVILEPFRFSWDHSNDFQQQQQQLQ